MPESPDNPTLLVKKKARLVSQPAANAFASTRSGSYNRPALVPLGFY
jgi:hypothetical protein